MMQDVKPSLEQLLVWNRLGCIPLPQDTEELYHERVQKILANSEKQKMDLLSIGELAALSELGEGLLLIDRLFEMRPSWVPVFYSSKNLLPWEAACSWSDVACDEEITIQLAPGFRQNKTLYGIYQKKEVLAHEYVHAARSGLSSDKFEEFFAYLVSKESFFGSFRACFGPLFRSSKESLFFCGIWLVSLFVLLFGKMSVAVSLLGCIIAFFFMRLSTNRRIWNGCLDKLKSVKEKSALPLMMRLTDEEITFFAKNSSEEGISWIEQKKENDFRWYLLYAAYFER